MKTQLCCTTISTFLVLNLVNLKLTSATTGDSALNPDDPHEGLHQNLTLQKTVQKSTQYCSSLFECNRTLGVFSTCNSAGRCVCDMGYEEKSKFSNGFLSYTCEKRTCGLNVDCMSKFGVMSHCFAGTCSCDLNYYYDTGSGTCTYSRHTNFGLVIGLPVAIAGLILIAAAILIVRRRRQRVLRGHLHNPNRAQNVIHPQQHPQPLYYQNPPAGVHHQNPPAFNPTFTGYQPTQPQHSQQYYQQQPPAPGPNPNVVGYPTLPQNH